MGNTLGSGLSSFDEHFDEFSIALHSQLQKPKVVTSVVVVSLTSICLDLDFARDAMFLDPMIKILQIA